MDRENFLLSIEKCRILKMMFQNARLTSMLILDLKGIILDANNSFLSSFGYHKSSLFGKKFSLLFIEEDKLARLPEKELEKTRACGSSNDNNYLLKGDGVPIWVHGENILIKDKDGQEFIIKVVHDIHNEKVLEEELKRKNEEQESIINDRNIFIYTVSHDLKSPLANIEGLVKGLKDSLDNPEELDIAIAMLDQSVERLTSKIDELAFIGKSQEEKKTMETEVKFQEVLNDILKDFCIEIKNSQAEIRSNFSKAPVIRFSRKNLNSILQNLVSNAIKFRSPDRKPIIVIDTETSGGFIILNIRDNGMGIKEDDKHKIFLMYQRLNSDIQGTGVGMAIIKRIVENSGGRIEIKSTVGKGSTFKIFLPAAP